MQKGKLDDKEVERLVKLVAGCRSHGGLPNREAVLHIMVTLPKMWEEILELRKELDKKRYVL